MRGVRSLTWQLTRVSPAPPGCDHVADEPTLWLATRSLRRSQLNARGSRGASSIGVQRTSSTSSRSRAGRSGNDRHRLVTKKPPRPAPTMSTRALRGSPGLPLAPAPCHGPYRQIHGADWITPPGWTTAHPLSAINISRASMEPSRSACNSERDDAQSALHQRAPWQDPCSIPPVASAAPDRS